MNKEIYSLRSKKTELSISSSEISAIKKSDTVKTGLRIYDGGYIGIAGAIGSYDENRLIDRAKSMLKFKTPYNCALAENLSRTVDLTSEFTLSDEELLSASEELLSLLVENHPQFTFSHKIILEENETRLFSDCGTELAYLDKVVFGIAGAKFIHNRTDIG